MLLIACSKKQEEKTHAGNDIVMQFFVIFLRSFERRERWHVFSFNNYLRGLQLTKAQCPTFTPTDLIHFIDDFESLSLCFVGPFVDIEVLKFL